MKRTLMLTLAFFFLIQTLQSETVYVGGSYKDEGMDYPKACYWVNGKKTDLNDVPPGVKSDAMDIVIKDGTVYIAGYYSTTAYPPKATICYWKDGVRTDVKSDGIGLVYHLNIAVENDTVCMAGYGSGNIVCYWKGNEKAICNNGYSSCGIAVSDGTVYVAGDVI